MADHSNNEDPEYPESPREVDGVCAICNHWVTNPSDFWDNFISCTSCPQSFHKDCVSKLTENNNNDSTDSNLVEDDHSKCICTDFINTKTNEPLQCTISRAAKSLFRTEEDGYNEISYLYDEDDNAYYWHPKDIRKKQKLLTKYGKHEDIFTRSQRRWIEWKGVRYHIGDCIELRNEYESQYETNVAIIKELYVYDEPNSVPGCSILWFWREQEVAKELEDSQYLKSTKIEHAACTESEKKYLDRHLYLDIDYEANSTGLDPKINEISLNMAENKVLVCNTFTEFLSYIEKKESIPNGYGNVFYGDLSINSRQIQNISDDVNQLNVSKLESSLFTKMDMEKLKEFMNGLDYIERLIHNKNMQRYDSREQHQTRRGLHRVSEYLDHFYVDYNGENEYICMEEITSAIIQENVEDDGKPLLGSLPKKRKLGDNLQVLDLTSANKHRQKRDSLDELGKARRVSVETSLSGDSSLRPSVELRDILLQPKNIKFTEKDTFEHSRRKRRKLNTDTIITISPVSVDVSIENPKEIALARTTGSLKVNEVDLFIQKNNVLFDELSVDALVSIIGEYILEDPELSKKKAAKRLKKEYKMKLKTSAIKKDERFKKALQIIKEIHS